MTTNAYAVFCGQIDQASVQRIFQTFTNAISNRFSHIHLLFQSILREHLVLPEEKWEALKSQDLFFPGKKP